jgi:hypothetical protein
MEGLVPDGNTVRTGRTLRTRSAAAGTRSHTVGFKLVQDEMLGAGDDTDVGKSL